MAARFNLRTRKSKKLTGQFECSSCKRYYFSLDFEDDENEHICCDCSELTSEKLGSKKPAPKQQSTTIAIKTEKVDSIDSDTQFSSPRTRSHYQNELANLKKNGLRDGSAVKIHFTQLILKSTNTLSTNDDQHVVKEEPIEQETPNVPAKKRKKTALGNKTNTMPIEPTEVEEQESAQLCQTIISKNDTKHTLREKFPNVNPFELEFLMFLRDSST